MIARHDALQNFTTLECIRYLVYAREVVYCLAGYYRERGVNRRKMPGKGCYEIIFCVKATCLDSFANLGIRVFVFITKIQMDRVPELLYLGANLVNIHCSPQFGTLHCYELSTSIASLRVTLARYS